MVAAGAAEVPKANSVGGLPPPPIRAQPPSGNASSTTTAGITGIAGDTSALTGKDTTNALRPIFNADTVRADLWFVPILLGGVLSHWLLDWISHRSDMSIVPGGARFGLAVWALSRLMPEPEFAALRMTHIASEADAHVRREWETA